MTVDRSEFAKWPTIGPTNRILRGAASRINGFGAGVLLDSSDNLYIIGGNTFDTTKKEFKVLSDIFVFQLRDPYYKYCSATGVGLFSAVAGIATPFYIQCRDAFGNPANSASFQVDITGKEGQPGMKPAPFALGNGEYKCEYAAFQTGQYEIRIYVGRGGGEYMDLLEVVKEASFLVTTSLQVLAHVLTTLFQKY